PPDERAERLGEYLVASLAAVLRLRPDRITLDTSIASLGFDSLMAMELRNRVEADFRVVLPVPLLLGADAPSVILDALVEETIALATTIPGNASPEFVEGEI